MTPAGSRPGEPRQVDRPFGVARTHQHPAPPRLQRKDVPGRDDVVGPRVARHRDPDRLGPLARRDAGGDPAPAVDADRERGVPRRSVVRRHHRQAQLRDALLGQRQADEAPPLARHEVDRLGRHQVGGHHQVALVLAILVVDEDQHAAGADRLDRARDRRVAFGRRFSGQSRTSGACRSRSRGAGCGRRRCRVLPNWAAISRSMCFTIMSASRLTVSPTFLSPSLVDLERVRDQRHREHVAGRRC